MGHLWYVGCSGVARTRLHPLACNEMSVKFLQTEGGLLQRVILLNPGCVILGRPFGCARLIGAIKIAPTLSDRGYQFIGL